MAELRVNPVDLTRPASTAPASSAVPDDAVLAAELAARPAGPIRSHQPGEGGYDFIHGTTEPGAYEGDDGTDPGGAEAIDPEHPFRYTEDGLRAGMGMEPRRHYRGPGPV